MTKKYSGEKLVTFLKDPVLFQEKLLDRPIVSETQRKILSSSAKRVCIAAGRRWGKTTMLAGYVFWYALKYEKAKIAVFAPSWEQVIIFIDTLKELVEEFKKHADCPLKISEYRRTQITIEGSKIIARSATKTSQSIRGHGADFLVRDEDAFIPDEKMKDIRPLRIRIGGRSKISKEMAASTTLGHNHFWKDFNSERYESYQVPTWDNKLIDKKDIEEDRDLMTEAEFNQEYGAQFLDDKYSVFPQVLIDAATCDRQIISEPRPDEEYVMGIDLGKRRDASVLYIIHPENNHLYIDVIKEFKNDFSGQFWTKIINEAVFYIKKFKVIYCNVDQTGIGDMPTEELKNAVAEKNLSCNVKGIDFTRRLKNSKQGLIASLLLKFERKEIHYPFYAKLIKQLKNIRYETSQSPNAKLETYGRYTHIGHDDHVIALALAVFALPATQQLFYTRSNKMRNTEEFDELPLLQVTNKFFDQEY